MQNLVTYVEVDIFIINKKKRNYFKMFKFLGTQFFMKIKKNPVTSTTYKNSIGYLYTFLDFHFYCSDPKKKIKSINNLI